MSDGNRAVIINDPDGLGAEIIGTAPLSDTGQRGIGVRILSALGGAGGGGPATIVDGGDVAQGAKADVAWVSGDGTVISLLKKIASGGGSAVSIADGADVAQGTTTDADTVSTTIGLLKKIKNLLLNPLAVTGTFWQATQPVSGTFFQVTQPVSLAANTPDVTDRSGRLLGHVTVDNASIPVTGTFFQGTQPVSGTFWQATQPVSGTVTSNVGTTGGLALDATVTGVAKDASLTTIFGAPNDSGVPASYTVLDRLGRLVQLSKQQQTILQGLLDTTKPKVVQKSSLTLLHRS